MVEFIPSKYRTTTKRDQISLSFCQVRWQNLWKCEAGNTTRVSLSDITHISQNEISPHFYDIYDLQPEKVSLFLGKSHYRKCPDFIHSSPLHYGMKERREE